MMDGGRPAAATTVVGGMWDGGWQRVAGSPPCPVKLQRRPLCARDRHGAAASASSCYLRRSLVYQGRGRAANTCGLEKRGSPVGVPELQIT